VWGEGKGEKVTVYVGMEEVSEGEEEDGRRRWCERNRRERVVSGELGAVIEGEIQVKDEEEDG